jgi:hypothetical protein
MTRLSCTVAAAVRITFGRVMDAPTLSSIIPIIQISITPVILISGMGLLLLTLTNRMGRIIDRTRVYALQLKQAPDAERRQLDIQLALTWRRAKIVRLALTATTASMLMSAALVIVIFAGALMGRDMSEVILVLFGGAILLLIAALVEFLHDIFVSLTALRLEVDQARMK